MKKALLVISFILLAASSKAQGEEQSKNANELMNVLGVQSLIESARQQNKLMAENELNSVLNQMRKENPRMTIETDLALKQAGLKFIDRLVSSWDSAEAANIYFKSLSEGLTDNEINTAIQYYSAPRGQKELTTIFKSVSKLQEYISSRLQKENDPAIKALFADLKSIFQKSRQNTISPLKQF